MKSPEEGGRSSSENFPPRERFLGREKLAGVMPLLVVKDSERNRKILNMWRIPGTTIRVSKDGDIFYPVWRERTRINKPELYVSISNLPRGWSLERLLRVRKERLISEVIFYQVKKEGGSIEAAIRSMDHVLEQYEEKGKEMEQIRVIRKQIERAIEVLENSVGVSEEEFEEGFGRLYQQTVKIMEDFGMRKSVLSLKQEIDWFLERASTGRDKTGRRNYLAVLKRLQAASKRVEYRASEAGFIIDKFNANKAGLIAEREKERRILDEMLKGLVSPSGIVWHEAFKKGKTNKSQVRILQNLVENKILRLTALRVKPYRTLAVDLEEKLAKLKSLIGEESFNEAKTVVLDIEAMIKRVLEEYKTEEEKKTGQQEPGL